VAGEEATRARLGQDLAVRVHRLPAYERAHDAGAGAAPVEGRPRVLGELLRLRIDDPDSRRRDEDVIDVAARPRDEPVVQRNDTVADFARRKKTLPLALR